jgi:hypothetical protein
LRGGASSLLEREVAREPSSTASVTDAGLVIALESQSFNVTPAAV